MLPVKNFYGKIDGKTIYDFSRRLNYELKTTEERLALIKELLYNEDGSVQKFFEEVFTQKFDLKKEDITYDEELDVDLSKLSYTGANISPIKLILSTEDNLYSETNIAKEIERITNYILFSLPKEQRTEYKIYKDEQLFNKMIKEQSLEGATDGDTDQSIHFLMTNNSNYKNAIEQKITKEDIERIPELKDYDKMLQAVKFKLQKIALLEKLYGKTNKFSKLEEITHDDLGLLHQYGLEKEDLSKDLYRDEQKNKTLLQKQSALIKEDMIMIKDAKLGTIYFKQPLADSTEIEWDELDFSNEEHMKNLLRIPPKGIDLQQDMVCMQYDLEKLIKDSELSERDIEILHMYRAGLTQEIIAKKLEIKQPAVIKYLDKIVKNIIDTYNKQYQDWYYLNIEKGTYKTCSKCGEVKILNKENFSQRKNGNYYNYCKECDKKSKK